MTHGTARRRSTRDSSGGRRRSTSAGSTTRSGGPRRWGRDGSSARPAAPTATCASSPDDATRRRPGRGRPPSVRPPGDRARPAPGRRGAGPTGRRTRSSTVTVPPSTVRQLVTPTAGPASRTRSSMASAREPFDRVERSAEFAQTVDEQHDLRRRVDAPLDDRRPPIDLVGRAGASRPVDPFASRPTRITPPQCATDASSSSARSPDRVDHVDVAPFGWQTAAQRRGERDDRRRPARAQRADDQQVAGRMVPAQRNPTLVRRVVDDPDRVVATTPQGSASLVHHRSAARRRRAPPGRPSRGRAAAGSGSSHGRRGGGSTWRRTRLESPRRATSSIAGDASGRRRRRRARRAEPVGGRSRRMSDGSLDPQPSTPSPGSARCSGPPGTTIRSSARGAASPGPARDFGNVAGRSSPTTSRASLASLTRSAMRRSVLARMSSVTTPAGRWVASTTCTPRLRPRWAIADQRGQEVGEFVGQRGELVDDHDEPGYRLDVGDACGTR